MWVCVFLFSSFGDRYFTLDSRQRYFVHYRYGEFTGNIKSEALFWFSSASNPFFNVPTYTHTRSRARAQCRNARIILKCIRKLKSYCLRVNKRDRWEKYSKFTTAIVLTVYDINLRKPLYIPNGYETFCIFYSACT